VKKTNSIILVSLLAIIWGQAQAVELVSHEQQYSYAMGARISKILKSQGMDKLDSKAFLAGVEDGIKGGTLQMSKEQMIAAFEADKAAKDAMKAESGKLALAGGQKFMQQNKTKAGVKTLDSGLQYLVITEGSGASPKGNDKVKVHYSGSLINGSKFDSSYDRGEPAVFGVGGVIPGFSEALKLMKPGGKWTVFIPSDLAYGARGAGASIGPNETLVFELELLEVMPEGK